MSVPSWPTSGSPGPNGNEAPATRPSRASCETAPLKLCANSVNSATRGREYVRCTPRLVAERALAIPVSAQARGRLRATTSDPGYPGTAAQSPPLNVTRAWPVQAMQHTPKRGDCNLPPRIGSEDTPALGELARGAASGSVQFLEHRRERQLTDAYGCSVRRALAVPGTVARPVRELQPSSCC